MIKTNLQAFFQSAEVLNSGMVGITNIDAVGY
jgi:hypothetical protein